MDRWLCGTVCVGEQRRFYPETIVWVSLKCHGSRSFSKILALQGLAFLSLAAAGSSVRLDPNFLGLNEL